MADINQSNWSETDASNDSAPPDGWPAGMNPSQVEPAMRAVMGAIKRWYDRANSTAVTSGTANTQTLTYDVAPDGYVNGDVYSFTSGLTNTGAATLNINALGAISLTLNGAALVGGELQSGRQIRAIYIAATPAFSVQQIGPTNGYQLPYPLRSYLAGLTLSNDATTPNSVLGIAAGAATDATRFCFINLASAITKSTAGAWASGTGSNGMGNGLTIADSTWYHVILANNAGSPDVYFDTDVGGANRPSSITDTRIRRIGSFKTDASGHILAFTQYGDDFVWAAPALDVAAHTPTSGAQNTVTLSVPLGVVVAADIGMSAGYASGTITKLFAYPTLLTSAPLIEMVVADTPPLVGTGRAKILTNTSAQITTVLDYSGSTAYSIETYGWTDRRGRDA